MYNLFYHRHRNLRKEEFAKINQAQEFAEFGETQGELFADCITDSNNIIIIDYDSDNDVAGRECIKSRVGQYFNLAGD